MTQNKKHENFGGYEKCEEFAHSSYPGQFFLVFLRSNFFPGYLKELEVYIVSMDDDKVEYGPKQLKKKKT